MAKQSKSTRRGADRDDEEADDGLAWQAPKKSETKGKVKRPREPEPDEEEAERPRKKSSGKSSTDKPSAEKRRASGSSSENPKAAKKASAKRKRDSSGDDEDAEGLSGSARSRRAGPPKKKGVDPIIIISILTATLLVCGGIIFIVKRPKPEPRNEKTMVKNAEAMVADAEKAFKAWAKAQREGPATLAAEKHKEAWDLLEKAHNTLQEALAPHRDAEGNLPKQYEGYEQLEAKIGTLRQQLGKDAVISKGG